MTVELSAETARFIDEQVRAGRYPSATAAVDAAVAHLQVGGASLVQETAAQDATGVNQQFTHRPAVRLTDTPVRDANSVSFDRLASQWRAERPRGADVSTLTRTPAYNAIINLGGRAVPLLLAELVNRPDHWFRALHAITGENPVPSEAEGKLKLMAAAWLRWGREQGYIGDDVD